MIREKQIVEMANIVDGNVDNLRVEAKMEHKELKPCPFCGGKEAEIKSLIHLGIILFNVMCEKCCATGGVGRTKEQAEEAWNRRANDGT